MAAARLQLVLVISEGILYKPAQSLLSSIQRRMIMSLRNDYAIINFNGINFDGLM